MYCTSAGTRAARDPSVSPIPVELRRLRDPCGVRRRLNSEPTLELRRIEPVRQRALIEHLHRFTDVAVEDPGQTARPWPNPHPPPPAVYSPPPAATPSAPAPP